MNGIKGFSKVVSLSLSLSNKIPLNSQQKKAWMLKKKNDWINSKVAYVFFSKVNVSMSNAFAFLQFTIHLFFQFKSNTGLTDFSV